MKKLILSLVILASLCLSVLSISAFAQELPLDKTKIYGTSVLEENTGDMNIIPMNNPNLESVEVGVGMCSSPAIMDYNGDGYLDLLLASDSRAFGGSYVFYGGPNTRKDNTFSKAYKIINYMFYRPSFLYDENGEYKDSILLCSSTRFTDMPNSLAGIELKNPETVWPKTSTSYDDYTLHDYNGDGYLDLIRGVHYGDDYGWEYKYTADGEWGDDNHDGVIDELDDYIKDGVVIKDTNYYDNDPIHGYVMVVLNDKGEQGPDGLPTYRNFGGEAILVCVNNNPETPVNSYGNPNPSFCDMDNDGDFDLVCGAYTNDITYYENIGTREEPVFAPAVPFKNPDGTDFVYPNCNTRVLVFDWDEDGILDLIVGQEDGYCQFVKGTGEFIDGIPVLSKPVYMRQQPDVLKTSCMSTPHSIDWDGDGDEDLFTGTTEGTYFFVENVTPQGGDLSNPSWGEPRRLVDIDGNLIRIIAGPNGSIQGPGECMWGYIALNMGDWDEDGDIDLVSNDIWGKIKWIENLNAPGEHELKFSQPQTVKVNDETPAKPVWNWWNPEPYELVTQWRTTPLVIDIDKDGLNDIAMLDEKGYLGFYKKRPDGMVETPTYPFLDHNGNPLRLKFSEVGQSGRVKFRFVDWDYDGDLDIVRDDTTSVGWLENVGDDETPFMFLSSKNLHSRHIVHHTTSPTVVDWDKNGIPDLVVGAEDGHFYYLKNNVIKNPLVDNLTAYWDFEETGLENSVMFDKASGGSNEDKLSKDTTVTIENGVATIPANTSSLAPIYAGYTSDLGVSDSLTVFVKAKLSSGELSDRYVPFVDKGVYSVGVKNGKISAELNGTVYEGSYSFPRNVWREVAFVFEKVSGKYTIKAYISGSESAEGAADYTQVLDVSTNISELVDTQHQSLLIGGTCNVDMSFDEVRIFNTSVTKEALAKMDTSNGIHEKSYYILNQATGDGRSKDSPAASVQQLLEIINEELPYEGNVARVYVMQKATCPDDNIGLMTGSNQHHTQGSFTSWYTSTESPSVTLNATTIVSTYDYENTGKLNYLAYSDKIGLNATLQLAGPTIFENIALVRPRRVDREIIFRGNSVEFNNVKFYTTDACQYVPMPYTKMTEENPNFWLVDGTTFMTYPQVVNFNSAFTQNGGIHMLNFIGGATHSLVSKARYPITVYLNNADINARYGWGMVNDSTTTYVGAGLNIVVNEVASLTQIDRTNPIVITGGLQIVNNNGHKMADLPANVTVDKVWITNSKKNAGGTLDVTDTPGVFKILGGKIAFAIGSDKNTVYYGKDTITLPVGEYDITYASSIDEFSQIVGSFANNYEQGFEFDKWVANSDNTLSVSLKPHTPTQKSYYVISGGTGDGRTPETPAGSVELVMPSINADLPFANDIATVYIMQKDTCPEDSYGLYSVNGGALAKSSLTPWVIRNHNNDDTKPLYTHTAKMVVTTYDPNGTGVMNYLAYTDVVGGNHALRLAGNTEFKNINLVATRNADREFTACGYDVTFTNVKFSVMNACAYAQSKFTKILDNGLKFFAVDGTTKMSAPAEIRFNSAFTMDNSSRYLGIVGGAEHTPPTETMYPITYYFDNQDITAYIAWGTNVTSKVVETKISAGLNIVINNVKSFTRLDFVNPVTIKGGVQIINNNGLKFPEIPSNVTISDGKLWILNSEKSDFRLDVTDVPGKFAIVGSAVATAVSSNGDVYTSEDFLTLPCGTYTVTYKAIALPVKKSYYVISGGTGDGRTVNTPAPSVEAVIPAINADLTSENDIAYVYIMQKATCPDDNIGLVSNSTIGFTKSSFTPWFTTGETPASYKATMVVTTYEYDKTGVMNYLAYSDRIGANDTLQLGGNTIFKDIALVRPRGVDREIIARGYDAEFTNVRFYDTDACYFNSLPYTKVIERNPNFWFVSANTVMTGPQTIRLNSAIYQDKNTNHAINIPGGASHSIPAEVKYPLTYYINHSDINAYITWGLNGSAETVNLSGGVNVVIEEACSLGLIDRNTPVNVTGGIQIIKNNGSSFPEIPSNVNADKVWVMNSPKGSSAKLDVTNVAGTFEIIGAKMAFAVSSDKTAVYYGSGTITLPAGTYDMAYADSIDEFTKEYSDVANDYENCKELSGFDVIAESSKLIPVYKDHAPVEINFYVLADATGDGRSVSSPAPSVEKVIPAINSDIKFKNDIARVHIMQKSTCPEDSYGLFSVNNGTLAKSSFTPWVIRNHNGDDTKPEYTHTVKMIVCSYDPYNTGVMNYLAYTDVIGGNHPLRLAGPTVFENINLLAQRNADREIITRGYDVEFNNVGFYVTNADAFSKTPFTKILNNALKLFAVDATTSVTAPSEIHFNSAFVQDNTSRYIGIVGGASHTKPNQTNYPITYYFNNSGIQANIVWGTNNCSHETKVSGGLNIVLNAASKLTLLDTYTDPVTITSLQIVNNNGLEFPEIPSNVTADKTWIVNSVANSGGTLDVTDVAGTFKVVGGKTAVAVDKTGKIYVGSNEKITLPAGEYDMYYLDKAIVGELPFTPVSDSQVLTGWSDGTSVLTADEALVSGKTYTAATTDISEYLDFAGVQIRLESGEYKQGLRFVADKKDGFVSYKFGMVLIPSKFIGDNRAYTDYSSAGGNSTNNIVGADKLFIGSTHEYNGKTYSSATVEAQKIFSKYYGGVFYTTCLTGIEEKDYATYYTAKAYVVYTFGGKEYVAYSEPFRSSIYEVARYAYENDNRLDSATKEYLQSIIGISMDSSKTLANTYRALTYDKKLTLGFLGGSITYGGSAATDITDTDGTVIEGDIMLSYANRTATWFEETFPEATIEYVNAGISDTAVNFANYRLADHLMNTNGHDMPDIVFVEFTSNDWIYNDMSGTQGHTEFKRQIESLVHNIYNHNPYCDIVFVFSARNNASSRPAYVEVAEHYGIQYIDMGIPMQELMTARGAANESAGNYYYTVDDLHPSSIGYGVYFEEIKKVLENALINDTPVIKEKTNYLSKAPKYINERLWLNPTILTTPSLTATGNDITRSSSPLTLGFLGTSKTQVQNVAIIPDFYQISGTDAKITFEFTGTTFSGIFYMTSDGVNMDYTIDGGEKKNFAIDNGATLQFQCFPHTQLFVIEQDIPYGNHKVELTFNPTSSGKVNIGLGGIAISGANTSDKTVAQQRQQILDTMNLCKTTDTVYEEVAAYNPADEKYSNIKAITFEGLNYMGEKTKIFAYLGFPEGASADTPVPAVVLVHGGGGHAFYRWVEMWNERGYAAIALDTVGAFPGETNPSGDEVSIWVNTLPAELAKGGYRLSARGQGYTTTYAEIEDQWAYHALSEIILAGNLLRNDPRVDPEKVGITGISWGGTLVSQVIGYDNRFSFAIPVYGNAYLSTDLHTFSAFGNNYVKALWAADKNLSNATMPIMWLAYNDDSAFSVPGYCKSYMHTAPLNSKNVLAMLDNWGHSHSHVWYNDQSFIFADSITFGENEMITFKTQPEGRNVNCSINIPENVSSVEVCAYYIDEPMSYSKHNKFGQGENYYLDQTWQKLTTGLSVDMATGAVTGTLPEVVKGYYIDIQYTVDSATVHSSSVYVPVE